MDKNKTLRDSMDEYKGMNIPTGIDMPGAELVYRIEDAPITKDTTIVINCIRKNEKYNWGADAYKCRSKK